MVTSPEHVPTTAFRTLGTGPDTLSAVDTLEIVAAVVVGILSAARITRLVTQDSFPPVAWVRARWDDRTDGGTWNDLLHCHWCFAPYATGFVMASGFLSHFHWTWWIFNLWLAASYLASMTVEHDEKD